MRRPSSTYVVAFAPHLSTYQLPTSCLSTDDRTTNKRRLHVSLFFLSVCMSAYPPFHLSASICYHLSIHPSIHLSIYISMNLPSLSLSLYPHMRLFFCISLFTFMLRACSINMKDVMKDVFVGACILVYIHKWTDIHDHWSVFLHISVDSKLSTCVHRSRGSIQYIQSTYNIII